MVDIIIAEPGSRLGYSKGLLVVRRDGETRYAVGINEVDSLLISTRGVSVSGTLIWHLASHGIPVYIVSSSGEPLAVVSPVDANKTADNMIAQAMWRIDPGKRVTAAKWFITAKIKARIWLLRRLASSRNRQDLRDEAYRLEHYMDRVRHSQDLREVLEEEARAGRLYWRLLAGLIPGDLGFSGRHPRGPDPVNRSLDYMYSILRSICHYSLIIAGFNPYIGFMHMEKSGRPSLTLDFMEPYRWAVEHAMLKLLSSRFRPEAYEGRLTVESRRMLYKALMGAMEAVVPGHKRSLRSSIRMDAWMLASALRREGEYLPTIPLTR